MKKLLAILAVTGIISSSSQVVISCKKQKIVLPEIEDLYNFIAKKGQDLIYITEKRFKEKITENNIEADTTNLKITMKDSLSGALIDKDTNLTPQTYKITLKATKDDKYFKNGKTTFNITVINGKQDLPKIDDLYNFLAKKGEVLFNKVDEKLNEKLAENNIEADITNLTITITDNDGQEVNENTALTTQTYKITITATKDDQYFNQGERTFNIATINNKQDLPEIDDFNFLAKTGQDLIYITEERLNEKLAENNIEADTTNLIITIKDKDSNIVDANTVLNPQTYKITIKTTVEDEYFRGKTTFNITVINNKQDLPEIDDFKFPAKTYQDLKDKVYEKFDEKLAENDLEADTENLIITITDNDNEEVNEDSGLLTTQTYKITIRATKDDEYFNQGKTTFNITVINNKQDLPEIDDIYDFTEKKGKDLIDATIAKLATESEIEENVIENDVNEDNNKLTIKITDQDGSVVNVDTDLTAQTYKITITATKNDEYFNQGKTTFNITVINKQKLPIIEPIILDKSQTQNEAKLLIQNKIANEADLSENNIKNDKNLSYEFYNDDKKTPADSSQKLISGKEYFVKITANAQDEYFIEGEIWFSIRVKKLDLATADLEINPFKAAGKKGIYLMHTVCRKISHLSGYWEHEIYNYLDLYNNMIKITDSKGNQVKKYTSLKDNEEYTIIINSIEGIGSFINRATFTVTLT